MVDVINTSQSPYVNFTGLGTGNININWGDGSTTENYPNITNSTLTHLYSSVGVYYISCKIVSSVSTINLGVSSNTYNNKVLYIEFLENSGTIDIMNLINNKISSFDFKLCPGLQDLSISRNELTEFDFTNLNLSRFDCSSNNISTLNVSTQNNLRDLYCGNNNLVSLDVSNLYNNLVTISCPGNNINEIIFPTRINVIKDLECSNNDLSSLTLTFLRLLTLQCTNNNLTSLNVSNSPTLSLLDIGNNNISGVLDLSPIGGSLESLVVNSNNITGFNRTTFTRLTYIDITGNNFSSLTLNDVSLLNVIRAENNMLTSLNITGSSPGLIPSNLQEVYLGINNISSLDFSNARYKTITYLDCNNNPSLNSLSLYNNALSLLNYLDVSYTNLSSLNISSLQYLSELSFNFISNVSFTLTTNVSSFTNLSRLAGVSSNQNTTKLDNILTGFSSNSPLNTGNINLQGESNDIPSATGLLAITNLTTIPKNWTITVNSP